MKFFMKDFFSKCAKSAVSCEFGHIYWRNPLWKTSFFVQGYTFIRINFRAIFSFKGPDAATIAM